MRIVQKVCVGMNVVNAFARTHFDVFFPRLEMIGEAVQEEAPESTSKARPPSDFTGEYFPELDVSGQFQLSNRLAQSAIA